MSAVAPAASAARPEAEPLALDSSVREVQVFRSGAVVTRLATLEAAQAAGADLLAFVGLPLSTDDDSVRVSVVDLAGRPAPGAGPQPADVQAQVVVPPLGALLAPPSEEALRAARERKEDLEARLHRLDTEQGWLDSLGLGLPQGKAGEAPPPAPVAAWTGLIAWVAEARARRAEERHGVEDDLRAALEEIGRLTRTEAEARARRDARADAVSKRVVLRLRGPRPAGPVGLRLEYRVPGARWVPTYVLRMARDGASAELGLRAHVVQASGEPWERVRLSLSTADLLRETALPELRSLRLGRRQPPPARRAWREPPTGAEALFEGLDRARNAPVLALPAAPPEPEPLEPDEALDLLTGAPADPFSVGAEALHDGDEGGAGADPFGPPAGLARLAEAAPSFAPPPPPRPAAAPAAPAGLSPLGAMMARRSADAEPAKKSAPAPARMRAGGRAEPPTGAMARPGGGGGPPSKAAKLALAFEDDEVLPDDALLRYAELAMRRWDAPARDRGKLLPTSWRDRLLDLEPRQQRAVDEAVARALVQARGAGGVALPPGTSSVEASAGAFDHRYDAQGLVDVPSDAQLHNVPLQAVRTPVRATLVVVPREGDQAVRVATLKNPLEAPLLAGPAEVYLEDEFLVTAPLRTVPAGGELTIGLGVEPALKVARNTFFEEETAGLLGGSLVLRHRVEVELASRLAQPVDVEVRERVPLPPDDEKGVDVQDEQAAPAWEKHAPQADGSEVKGGRRWRLTLRPGEEKKLVARYALRIDGKNELVGGNRRD